MSVRAASEVPSPAGEVSDRWRLHRAGIVNVYQYENEVLHFGGGRLLLRGVNGSGKSTAMNMLLPFLLTALPGRIDAAGEQVGILKAWMLSGRDDPQPVGYLWIEFERRGEYLACGCGIKANRQSDTVTTWWFVTAKRPGIDFDLLGGGSVPLTAYGLRAILDDGEVYNERRRRDYRREIERRLFGGASIDQHIGLVHLVRSPRVGDRIDVDLPQHLTDALPQLSEEALAEAAQPLDDLEEHRRNVAELERTVAAIDGLLDVYRAYCVGDLRRRVTEGRERLGSLRRRSRYEKAKRRAAAEAGAEVGRLDEEIARLESEEKRLRNEIAALEESEVYSSGLQLAALADLVKDLGHQRTKGDERVAHCAARVAAEGTQVRGAQRRCSDDLEQLKESLAGAARLMDHCRLARRPPGPVQMPETSLEGLDATEPAEPFDGVAVERGLGEADGALVQRRGDLAEVKQARRLLDEAVERQRLADSALETADLAARSAAGRLAERTRALAVARQEWAEHVRLWASQVSPLLHADSVAAPAVDALAAAEGVAITVAHEDLRAELLAAAATLVTARSNAVAALRHRLADERVAAAQARAVVDELAARTEPDPPRFTWQAGADHCLADLIDFSSHLDGTRRAGLEAALEASGLLGARLVESVGAELASGELVAIAAEGVSSPLSDLLTVTVPDRLVGVVNVGLAGKLLDSISADPSTGAATAAGTDGSFRVGALEGRNRKERAEFIGATARREALARDRRAAAEALGQALAVVATTEAELGDLDDLLDGARRLQSELPGTGEISSAAGAVDAATATAEEAEDTRREAAEQAVEAERAAGAASDELRRRAVTLSLPADRDGLASVRADLDELDATLERCRSRSAATARSAESWSAAVARWRSATEDQRNERAERARIGEEHDRQYERLVTIERSIGEEYQKVVAERDRCRAELDAAETRLPAVREDRDAAVGHCARAEADAKVAAERRTETEQACEELRLSLERVVATPGLLQAVAVPGDEGATEPIVAVHGGSKGLDEMLGAIERLLPAGPGGTPEAAGVDINSVHGSLLQRRDALGAGWDAEARQASPSLPLVVEVAGPTGRAPLAEAARAVAAQHSQLVGLLDRKQADALRELLQGLIATEIAEKVDRAGEFVHLMNERLDSVATAHDVGVRLRWRRSPELDAPTARMVELLATRPDLRLEEDEHELRSLLSVRLDEARTLEPDVPYRQLIAATLDYKQWYELAVMVQRGGGSEARLSRRTPLSEGEKKIVTYLSLFAAVAASHDALTAQRPGTEQDRLGIARFVLLDDAFAKVSEDNHAALFGLLVDLDLDLIATSERLWGTHASVPQLAITEVIRDADLRTILLEHYHWDGATLARREAP
ncbi:MAG: TIGR02680 family protein [bacterium]|nr:TIGR02680 family protein [bacterium]